MACRARPWRAPGWSVQLLIVALFAVLVRPSPAAFPVGGAHVPWPCRLRLNWSASLPRGLYLLVPAPPAGRRALRPGDMVLTCPPAWFAILALARHYLPPGVCPGGVQPLGKLVLAVAGDRLDVEPRGISLDQRCLDHTAAAATDTAGRPLPHRDVPAGEHAVAPGEIWLIAPHPRSLDSRYFGPVPAADLQGRLVPLLVERGAARAAAAAMAGAIRRAAGRAGTAGATDPAAAAGGNR